jgi:ribonuclease-3
MGKHNNERLEFLGDAILGLVIAEALFEKYPQSSEGQMSRMRAYLVKGKTLAKLAKQFNLGDYMQLGPGELKSGGHRRESILADGVEAILGAIYLESGKAACQACILDWYAKLLEEVNPKSINKDPKTRLQEWLQARQLPLPKYKVLRSSGEAHDQTFWVSCEAENAEGKKFTMEAECKNRQQGEQQAAEAMLVTLAGGET